MLENVDKIGKRIREKREEIGLKQNEFAKSINIDNTSLNRYENGKQTPSLEILVAISRGLNTSLDYLVFGNGGENPTKVNKGDTTYAYKVLRAMVTLIEEEYMQISNANSSCKGILLNMRQNPDVLYFFKEISNFCKCRKRMTDKAFEDGVSEIIKEYEWRLINEDQLINPPLGKPNYSRIEEDASEYQEVLNEMVSENK